MDDVEVVAVPCAIPRDKLIESMKNWIDSLKNNSDYILPTVLDAKCKWVPYGHLYKTNFSVWEFLQRETGIQFDLTYAPNTWRQVLWDWDNNLNKTISNTIYVHCGGQEGNKSQLRRYSRKWPDLEIANINQV